jgi:hypothetical protein
MAEAAIDVGDLGADAGRQFGQQESGRIADVVDRHITSDRRLGGELAEQLAEIFDAGRSQRLDRPGRDAVDPHSLAAHGLRQVAHARLQAGLGESHGVVVRHHPKRTQIAQGQQRGPRAQTRRGELGHGGKAVSRDVVRDAEVFARESVQEIPGNRLARRKADRVDEAVELRPGLAQLVEEGGHLLVAADIAVEDELGIEFGGELGDAVLEALALIAERQLSAFAVAGAGDAVSDGAVGQHARDQQPLAGEKAHDCLL